MKKLYVAASALTDEMFGFVAQPDSPYQRDGEYRLAGSGVTDHWYVLYRAVPPDERKELKRVWLYNPDISLSGVASLVHRRPSDYKARLFNGDIPTSFCTFLEQTEEETRIAVVPSASAAMAETDIRELLVQGGLELEIQLLQHIGYPEQLTWPLLFRGQGKI